MNKFFDSYKQQKLTQEEMNSVDSLVSIKEIEIVVKNLSIGIQFQVATILNSNSRNT